MPDAAATLTRPGSPYCGITHEGKATTPQYITTPGAGYDPRPDLHRIMRKDSGKAIYNVN